MLGLPRPKKRVNNLTYKEDTGNLNLIDVANDFYTGNSHRLSNSGHFSEVDLC